MFCPKCGNEVDLFADKCLCCGRSFKNLTLKQRQNLKRKTKSVQPKKSLKRNASHKKSKTPLLDAVQSTIKPTETRIEYNNGYACKEGMSFSGRKLKKGSFKKRANNEGIGFHLPAYGLGEYPY